MKKSECRRVEVISLDIPFITVASLHTVGYECRVPLQVEVLRLFRRSTHTGNGLLQCLHLLCKVLFQLAAWRWWAVWAGPRQSRTQEEILLQPFANDLYLFEPGHKCFCSAGLVCLQVSKRSMSITSGDQKLCSQAARPIDGTSYWKRTGAVLAVFLCEPKRRQCLVSSFSCLRQRHSWRNSTCCSSAGSPSDRSKGPTRRSPLPFSLVVWKDGKSGTPWAPRSGRDIFPKFGSRVHPDWVPGVISATCDFC